MDSPAFFVVGVFGHQQIRLYTHPDKEQLEWWLDGLRTVGMSRLKGITRIMGPKTESQMSDWIAERGRRGNCQYEILGISRVVLPWEAA